MKLSINMRPIRLAGFALLLCAASIGSRAASAVEPAGPGNAAAPVRSDIAIEGKSLVRGAKLPDWVEATAPPDTAGQGPLVVRLSDVQIHVDGETAVYMHRMIQANDASMLTTVGRIAIDFQPEYQHVDLHALRIIRGTASIDKTNSAEIRFLQREENLDDGVYTGEVTASIVMDDIRVGDTVDMSYTITGQNPVFGGKFFHAIPWDSLYPTQRRQVLLNAPADRPISYMVLGGDGAETRAKVKTAAGRKIVRFVGDNLPAVDFERYAPPDVEQFRTIQFSEYKNWQQVAQWADGLFTSPSSATSLDEALNAIGTGSPEEMAQKALRYVQTEIRYLSVSLGENSHRPFPPDIVLARRFGDCKDKAFLLVALLRKLGIEASPVLVSTVFQKGLDKMLPSPLPFDHAIVRATVNGQVYFLDPTRSAQFGTLASMGQAHGGNDALVVGTETARLASIPYATGNVPVSDLWTEKVEIDKGGSSATMLVSRRYAGLQAESVRYVIAHESKTQLRKLLSASIVRRYPSAEVSAEEKITDDHERNVLGIEMRFRIPGFLGKSDEGWVVRYEPSNLRERFYLPDNPRRRYPLAVPDYPSASRYEFELVLPDEFNADYKPSHNTVANPAFTANETFSFKGHVINASVELNITKDRAASRDAERFMADVREFGKMLEDSLTIRRLDLKDSATLSVLDAPLRQRLIDTQEALIAADTRLLEDSGSDGHEIARCERGRAYARLGRKSDALADIETALRQSPGSSDLIACRAEILFLNGAPKASEADYSRALALGGDEGRIRFQRGMVYYLENKWKEAADDFRHAVEASTDRGERVRADVMRIFSLRRAKSKEGLSASVSLQDGWPEVALDFAAGSKSEDELLRQVHRNVGDDLDMALSEAYFYLGQYYLVAGNKLKAGVYLQRSADKGILEGVLRAAASIQVEQLKK